MINHLARFFSFGIEAMATEPNFPLKNHIFEKIMWFSRDD